MTGGGKLPIIIPLLESKDVASIDELDDHIIPTALRRAVIARDRHAPGKAAPGRPGDGAFRGRHNVHHILAWADGGETVLANLCLLCRYHHTLIHRHEGDLSEVLNLKTLEPAVGHRPS